MKAKLALLFLFISFNTFAYFNNSLYPQCSFPYRKDSFGLGMFAFFKNKPMPTDAKLFDSGCFMLGKEWAQTVVLESVDPASCPREFDEGYRLGLTFDLPSAGTGCFNAGFDAGVAKLHSLARNLDTSCISKECVQNYKNGLKDGCSQMAPTLTTDRFLSECYVTGWNDGDQFRGASEVCH